VRSVYNIHADSITLGGVFDSHILQMYSDLISDLTGVGLDCMSQSSDFALLRLFGLNDNTHCVFPLCVANICVFCGRSGPDFRLFYFIASTSVLEQIAVKCVFLICEKNVYMEGIPTAQK
jgi:hypothetical protein